MFFFCHFNYFPDQPVPPVLLIHILSILVGHAGLSVSTSDTVVVVVVVVVVVLVVVVVVVVACGYSVS